ncbi:MAG TPA: SDR family NAD(P)-dependent oxidoreductase, partial [Longimicrobiales bacterium]
MNGASELFSLAGKTAVVTGASRGLGQAMAVALAHAGADVVCISTQLHGTDETASQIRAAGRQAWQLDCDL